MPTKSRCLWVEGKPEYYLDYHDHEWGVPIHDDQLLFEMLILEGAQAGLSWETVLKKRTHYQQAFDHFVPELVAAYSDPKLEDILKNSPIIKNRLKVFSVRQNAQCFLNIQKEYGSFADYLWAYVNHQPIKNHFSHIKEVPAATPLSDHISKDLKKRGFKFVGSTIIYAYMQAVGLVNDHTQGCFLYAA